MVGSGLTGSGLAGSGVVGSALAGAAASYRYRLYCCIRLMSFDP